MKRIGQLAALVAFLISPAVLAGPNVVITKKCPGFRYQGRPAEFEIEVTNRGDAPALNVVVTDTITGGFEFVSADNEGVRDGNRIVWRLGTLEAGKSRTLSTKIRCTAIGTVKNVAKVTYCAEARADCEFDVKGIPAILLECVDAPDPVEVGENVTYTIDVLNQGTIPGTNIVITCTVPAGEEYVASDGPTKAKIQGKTVKFAPLGALAPKKRAVYKVTVKGKEAGDVRFKVELQSDMLKGPPVMETESTHIY